MNRPPDLITPDGKAENSITANEQPLNLEEIGQRLTAAETMVNALCDGSERWVMRVPAQPDRDPDLVISAALTDARSLLAHVERDDTAELIEALEELVSYTKACEGLLNASPAGQVEKAEAALAKWGERNP